MVEKTAVTNYGLGRIPLKMRGILPGNDCIRIFLCSHDAVLKSFGDVIYRMAKVCYDLLKAQAFVTKVEACHCTGRSNGINQEMSQQRTCDEYRSWASCYNRFSSIQSCDS